ncbi:MAG: HD domain-containing protein [Ruminococcaceae bacterium]|nr:HD domain-containing protein [Oscillospiraceae bacterium]
MSENLIPEYSEYKSLLQRKLVEKRYFHSLCVADEAMRLAEKYGGNAQKAYLAGLLHDITKNSSKEEHLNIFNTFGIILNNVEEKAEKLWHAISGAIYVRYILNIEDEEIAEAIRYHTTAKADMPLLSKILYLADFTSRDRDYDDVDVMRRLVDESLDKAYLYALSYSVKDLVMQNRAIHNDTLNAYNEAVLKGSSF